MVEGKEGSGGRLEGGTRLPSLESPLVSHPLKRYERALNEIDEFEINSTREELFER